MPHTIFPGLGSTPEFREGLGILPGFEEEAYALMRRRVAAFVTGVENIGNTSQQLRIDDSERASQIGAQLDRVVTAAQEEAAVAEIVPPPMSSDVAAILARVNQLHEAGSIPRGQG